MDWFTPRNPDEARPARAGRPRVTELSELLLIGEYPRREDIAWLKSHHRVTAVHSLQDNDDLKLHGLSLAVLEEAYRQSHLSFVRTPIPDAGADAMALHLKAALEALRGLTEARERVFLHCNAGMNRAPTLAIALMRAAGGMSLAEALAHVKQRHFCGPYMTILEDYFGPRDFKPQS
ncbi:MAG TPA: dual specificity protein phosphatase family protein [Candidatus Binataceae bacterium]|nr:dual specificity protein phosphatase family protein [Candidatus Binataceae bacterium]